MCTVANVKTWSQHDVGICPGSGVFKTHTENVPFLRAFSHRKYRFTGVEYMSCLMTKYHLRVHFLQDFRFSCIALCFCAIIAIKHEFLCTNICWAPQEELKPSPVRLGFSAPPSGAQKVLCVATHVWSLYFQVLCGFFLLQLVLYVYVFCSCRPNPPDYISTEHSSH